MRNSTTAAKAQAVKSVVDKMGSNEVTLIRYEYKTYRIEDLVQEATGDLFKRSELDFRLNNIKHMVAINPSHLKKACLVLKHPGKGKARRYNPDSTVDYNKTFYSNQQIAIYVAKDTISFACNKPNVASKQLKWDTKDVDRVVFQDRVNSYKSDNNIANQKFKYIDAKSGLQVDSLDAFYQIFVQPVFA